MHMSEKMTLFIGEEITELAFAETSIEGRRQSALVFAPVGHG